MYTVQESRRKSYWKLVVIILVLIGYIAWALYRPLPDIKPSLNTVQVTKTVKSNKLAWPGAGESAVGIVGDNTITYNGSNSKLPIASTAKLITCLAVLSEKPLKLGQQGPIITMTAKDVALYEQYLAAGGSVVKVVDGEQISEYQMIQTIMLPSANNMADSLVDWAFGSTANYSEYANAYLKKHGINNTNVGVDASGLSPTSTSTAEDLVKIGKLAMENPVLAEVVGQKTATGIPVVNDIKNVNYLLGTNGIIGVKTGNTDEAGGVFVSASTVKINERPTTIVTSVIGAPNLVTAMNSSVPLITSSQQNFPEVTLVAANRVVGHYDVPWGDSIPAKTGDDLSFQAFGGNKVSANVKLESIPANSQAGKTVGTVRNTKSGTTPQQTIPVNLSSSVKKAPITWRLIHPFGG